MPLPDSNMPTVDPDLGNAALAKIASGKALQELDPAEQAAVGKMGTYALQGAMAKRTAPKPAMMNPAGQNIAPPARAPANALPSAPAPKKPNMIDVGSSTGDATVYAPGQSIPSAPSITVDKPGNYIDVGSMSTGANVIAPPPAKLADTQGQSALQGTENPMYYGPVSTPSAKTTADLAGADKRKDKYPPSGDVPVIPKEIAKMDKRSLADIIGNVLDVLGSGAGGYAGRASPTMLQKQKEAQIAGEQRQAEINAEIEGKVKMMPLELQQALEIARQTGNYDVAKQKAIAKGILPYEIEKIEAARKYGLLPTGSASTTGQAIGASGGGANK